jgi:hypothetical protein
MALAAASLVFLPAYTQGQSATAGSSDVKTPRTADGHPDLTGLWHTAFGGQFLTEVSPDGKTRGVYIKNETDNNDGKGLEEHVAKIAKRKVEERESDSNRPAYKPEFQAKVQDLMDHYTHTDPTFRCEPPGVPRLGAPHQIVQSPGQVVFLYATNVGNFFRVIPTDGRPHRTDLDPSYMGDSVGHWEGDTLVVDSIGFNDETWLAADKGYFHSEALHVVERISRDGNQIHYGVTVEDPQVLTKPWTIPTRTIKMGGPADALPEADPCHDQDEPHMPKGVFVY